MCACANVCVGVAKKVHVKIRKIIRKATKSKIKFDVQNTQIGDKQYTSGIHEIKFYAKKQSRLQCVHLCVCAAAYVYVCSVEIKQERKKNCLQPGYKFQLESEGA